jgi:hypothetical protein
MRRRFVVTASATVAVAGAIGTQLTLGSDPAAAHTTTYIWGDDEPILGQGYVNVGNDVGTWQHIVYSSGQGPGSNVDGYFGPITAANTAAWESWAGIAVNGIVENGPNHTWSRARQFVFPTAVGIDYSFYAFPGVLGRPHTGLALRWSTLTWKWRGACAGDAWIPMDHHQGVTFQRTC